MKFLRFDPSTVAVEIERPAAEKLLAGDPEFRTWNYEEVDGTRFAGVWESTPGKWTVSYDEWEFCHILKGVSILTSEDGDVQTLKAGDSFVIRPGFKGTWEVVETTAKEYVIQL